MEYWSIGVMEYWSIGVMEYWSIGVMEYWSIGKILTRICFQSFPYSALLSLTTKLSIQSPRSRFRSKFSMSFRRPFSNL
jgi:hypothetical protein